MNKNILSVAAGKVWLFALLLVIFSALLALPLLEHLPFLGNLIYIAIMMSFLFMGLYMRDAAYAFEGEERVILKDAAMGFALIMLGFVVEQFGTLVMAIIWDIVFGVLVLIGAVKLMGAFGKLKTSTVFPDTAAAGKLKLAAIFFLLVGILGILYAIPALGVIFGVFYKILLLVAAIIFLVGWGKIKNLPAA